MIMFNFELHNYPTRNTDEMKLAMPKVNKEKFKLSLQYYGPLIWNNLPNNLLNENNFDVFKAKSKFYYFYGDSTIPLN